MPKRESGDRVLPAPYDRMSAADRELWLICEAVYNAMLTEEVRAVNVGHPMTEWQDLVPEAQQALTGALLPVIQAVHGISLNPKARREA